MDGLKPYSKNAKKRAQELYRLNREEKLKYVREYRIKNAEMIKLKKKLKYLQDRDRILKKQKEYYSTHTGEVAVRGKIYRKTHSESILIRNRNRKSLLRTLSKTSDIDNKYLANILEKSVRCPLCGKEYKSKTDKHIDHIKPLSMGGEHKKSNVRVICQRCNLTRPKNGKDIN